MTKEVEKTIADYASVSMTTQVGSGPDATNLVVQSHVDITRSGEDIDVDLDKLAQRLERQRVIGEIPAFVENIERCKSQIRKMNEDMQRLDGDFAEKWKKSGKTGDPKDSPQNAKHRKEVLLNIKTLEDSIQENENKLSFAIEVRDGKTDIKAVKTA